MTRVPFEDWIIGGKTEPKIKRLLFADDSNSGEIRRLKRALSDVIANELTTTQKNCIELYYYDGYALDEIAEKNGTSRQAVCACKKRAERRISRIMKYAVKYAVQEV